MNPALESDWVILYRIEGAKQVFVNNTSISVDSILVGNKKKAVGSFSFTLPKNTKAGYYRATYRLEGATFVDFFFNNENVSFVYNPDYPNETVVFTESKENQYYKNYINSISPLQQSLDSLQVAAIQNPNADLSKAYQSKKKQLDSIHSGFVKATENMYIAPFIKATVRNNSDTIFKEVDPYMSHIKKSFFDAIDFSDQTLINSSFITDRILDYIFYLNYSENPKIQRELFKKSTKEVLDKITNLAYKKEIIEFLGDQFQAAKNVFLMDYLLDNFYKKLPANLQDQNYIIEKVSALAGEVGRKAPNFAWQENGATQSLHKLNDGEQYILVFYSTTCSHCLREIPELYTFMQSKPNTKVVAFALENDSYGWDSYKKTLSGWHHVLGLNKWQNKTARTYQVNATPSYFVLDKNKTIIAKPDAIKDVKSYLNGN